MTLIKFAILVFLSMWIECNSRYKEKIKRNWNIYVEIWIAV